MEQPRIEASAEPEQVLRVLRNALSRIYHDTNNPLSIISGNAQFFLEIARAMDADDELVQPVRDIEEASERVAAGLRKLSVLRGEIEAYLMDRGAAGTS